MDATKMVDPITKIHVTMSNGMNSVLKRVLTGHFITLDFIVKHA